MLFVTAALIQLMAASEAKRDVCYFTFQDTKLVQDLYDVHSLLCQHNKTVGMYCLNIYMVMVIMIMMLKGVML